MNRTQHIERLAQLLEEAQRAHEQRRHAGDPSDPDWALAYASYLHAHAGELVPSSLSTAQLVKVLLDLDEEHAARAPEAQWATFFATLLVEHFVASSPDEQLQLFISRGCGFCHRVLHVAEELGITLELRDIYRDPEAYKELMGARGRGTVPVLRCRSGDVVRYMPESADIIRYLRARFGTQAHA